MVALAADHIKAFASEVSTAHLLKAILHHRTNQLECFMLAGLHGVRIYAHSSSLYGFSVPPDQARVVSQGTRASLTFSAGIQR